MLKELEDKKCIFFDVGFTLDRPLSGDWLFTAKFIELGGEKFKQKSKEEILAAKDKGGQYNFKNHLCFTIEEEIYHYSNFYKIIADDLHLGFSYEDILAIAKDRATNMENYIVYDDAIEVLTYLKDKYKLGIISDTWPSIENQLKYIGVYNYFDFYTYSCCLGVFKPDKRMYLDALSKSGCDPKDCVFIDDNPKNLISARELGITPILIAANPNSDVETDITKIHSLRELIK